MRAPLASLPALPIAVGLVAGILCGNGGMAPGWVIAIVVGGVALMTMSSHLPAFFLYSIGLGWLAYNVAEPTQVAPAIVYGEHLTVYGEVMESHLTSAGQSLVVEVDSVGGLPRFAPFRTMVALPDAVNRRAPGTVLEMRGAFLEARDACDFPGQRDYSVYRRQHGAVATFAAAVDSITTVGRRGNLAAWCHDRRESVCDCLVAGGLDDRAFGIISAIIPGDREYIDTRMQDDFRSAGVAHALALSGFHVGVIAMLASLALFPLRLWPGMWNWRLVLTLALVWTYALVTGLGASVARAALMLTCYVVARLLGREASPLNALCVAVAIILCAAPLTLWSPGFQLSVTAVLGILGFSDILNPVDRRRPTMRRLLDLLTIPLSAMLGTVLLTVWYFGFFPLYFAVSNLLISLCMPVLMTGGLLIAACGAWDIPSGVAAAFMNWSAGALDGITEFIASLPGARLGPMSMSWMSMALWMAVIAGVAAVLRVSDKRVRIACGMMVAAGVCGATMSAERLPDDEIFVSSAGGHTAVMMRSADTAAMVVLSDTMPTTRAHVEREWEGYLRSRRLSRLNAVDYDFSMGPFARQGDVLTAGGRKIHVCMRRTDDSPGHVDYSLITPRYRGKPAEYLSRVEADTVVLASNLSPRRTRAWIESCERLGRPYIDMHRRAWRPTIK